MRSIFSNLLLFLILVFAISALTNCTKSPTADDGSAQESTPGNVAGNEVRGTKRDDYPPIAAAVAQADLKNLDGTTFKVADKKGKVLLLNMWATWCGPCRSEMPALVKMQDAHRDNGFEVIGLNTDDETVEDIQKFATEMKLNYTLVWADTDMQAALLRISKFNGIPQTFIVDREGNLRGVFRGANPADIKKMRELVDMVVSE